MAKHPVPKDRPVDRERSLAELTFQAFWRRLLVNAQLPRPSLLVSVRLQGLALVLLCAGLTGCSSRSFDVGRDGERVYIDRLDPASREAAIHEISSSIRAGVSAYRLAPGDTLEVIFLGDSHPSNKDYQLGVGDQILIEFAYQGNFTRTEIIRPDGKISLPDRGDITAAALSPGALEAKIRQLYKNELQNPVVSVALQHSANGMEDLKQAVTTAGQGRGKTFIVSPDGTLSLPLIAPTRVAGGTITEATDQINQRYADDGANIRVSAHLTSVSGSQVFVFGEVRNPGAQPLIAPRTILQTVAAAGGVLQSGALSNVRMLYWDKNNEPRMRHANLEAVLEDAKFEEDMIVPPNSTIYVPPTGITEADRFVDQYIRQLLMFQGSSFTTLYQINGNTVNNLAGAAAIP